MTNRENGPTCYWLTPTRIMPHPCAVEARTKLWTCLRHGCPRPMGASDLLACPTCPDWEPRTFDAAKRDVVFETWGVGIPIPEPQTFDEVRRDLVWKTWGVS